MMTRKHPMVYFLISFFLGVFFRPECVWAHPAPGIEVSILNGAHGAHTLEGEFTIAASSRTAWEVLTDYERMSSFVSSIKSSKKTDHGNGSSTVDQEMTGQAGIFHKRIYVQLEVNEQPFHTIAFRDVSKKSFKSYAGAWRIESLGETIKVRYRLEATPDFFSPDFIAIGAFKKNVALLLEEVKNEIVKRNK